MTLLADREFAEFWDKARPSSEMERIAAEHDRARKDLDKLQSQCGSVREVLWTSRHELDTQIKELGKEVARLKRQRTKARKELKDTINDTASRKSVICQSYAMASVPFPMVPLRSLKGPQPGVPEIVGVYFLWWQDEVEYVGMSVNLSQRVTLSHGRVRGAGQHVSWIEYDLNERKHAELFYIWLLRPKQNTEWQP